MPATMVALPWFRVCARVFMAWRARSKEGALVAKVVIVELSEFSSERTWGSLPCRALSVSVMMVCSWLRPPPFSKAPRAPSTSSTLGAVVVWVWGMVAPGADRGGVGGQVGRRDHGMKSSPSGVSKRTCMVVPAGRVTDFLMAMVTVAWKLLAAMFDT